MGLENLTGFLCNWVPLEYRSGVLENKGSEPFAESRRPMSELSDFRTSGRMMLDIEP